MTAPSFFCNTCGMRADISTMYGREFKVCSRECLREAQWRTTLSVLREPYRPDPEPYRRVR